MMTIHWTHPWLGIASICLVISALLVHYWQRPYVFSYSLTATIARKQGASCINWLAAFQKIFWYLSLVLAVGAAGGPAVPEGKTSSTYQGIDIMVVLDVSGSMQQQDATGGNTRLAIAKEEAIRFISQRPYDAIGLVIFAYGAVCRCPLTHDHQALRKIIESVEINTYLPPHMTHLFRGLATAINRLAVDKNSRKVMILITDGNSTQGDAAGDVIVSIARSLGITVYAIGIGAERMQSPFTMLFDEGPNQELLTAIAQATGGRSYMAYSQEEMHKIYADIDALEKKQYEVQLIGNYRDIGWRFVFSAFLCYLLSLLLAGWTVIL